MKFLLVDVFKRATFLGMARSFTKIGLSLKPNHLFKLFLSKSMILMVDPLHEVGSCVLPRESMSFKIPVSSRLLCHQTAFKLC